MAIIPARGGSKRIPGKNLRVVAGKSLLAHAIAAARAAGLDPILVSTDDEEIARQARADGAAVPWLRPAALAQDDTPTLAVVLHALEWAARSLNPAPEFAVLLEPTAPLRSSLHIREALRLLSSSDADSVVSVCELPHAFNPEELLVVDAGRLRAYASHRSMNARNLRGKQPPAFIQNGLVIALRAATALSGGGLYGENCLPLVTDWSSFLDVDLPEDLELARFKMGAIS